MNKSYVALALVSLLVGCASSAAIPDREAEPQMLIAAAEERGAERNPDAQLHLQLALDNVNDAQKLADDGKEKDAELLLLRAEADAEYALTLLRRDEARTEAEAVRAQIAELRNEMKSHAQ